MESSLKHKIVESAKTVFWNLNDLSFEDKINAINEIKLALHAASPMVNEPVDCVLWVKNEEVIANDYNPNSVAPPEMKLLETSITEDGYTQPIVTYPNNDIREVVDGFHRSRVGKESDVVRERVFGYVPVVTIKPSQEDKSDRMAATIRHNRARGKHRVDSMSEIVLELKRRNWSDAKIAKNLGMDADEILRLSQIGGLVDMFADKEFSEAWQADSINETDNLNVEEEAA
jgi:ParB-like chromosome segregation protein Spo0J